MFENNNTDGGKFSGLQGGWCSNWASWLLHQTESQVCYVISEFHIDAEVTGRRKCVEWGCRSWMKPMEIVSLKGDNQWNKLSFSGFQTVINVKVVCDITYEMYLLCCRDWEIKSEIGLIHVGTSQLVTNGAHITQNYHNNNIFICIQSIFQLEATYH